MRAVSVVLMMAASLCAQVGPPRPTPPEPPRAQPQPQAQPAKPAQTPPQQAPQTQPAQQANPAPLADNTPLLLNNVSLTEMIDLLAKRLRINFILDPGVKGSVTIYTYGEVKPVDLMPLMETILRINNYAMVQVGDLYRIVPIAGVSKLPIEPQINADPKTLPDDERMVLNLVFLKYSTARELDGLIAPFLGEGASHSFYEPANLLMIEDNSRSMRRTMELIGMFDSDAFAGQRVKLFEVENSRPSDLVKELDQVFKAYALSDKQGSVKFLPVDRINVVIAVAPNPGIFTQVESWIKKLDIPVKVTAGATNNYVYRLRYQRAETVAMAVMALYTGNASALIAMASMANASMFQNGIGMGNYGASMGGGYGMSPYGYNGLQGGGYSPYGGGFPYGGNMMYGNAAYGNMAYMMQGAAPQAAAVAQTAPGAGAPAADQTGSYLAAGGSAGQMPPGMPHVIPNPFDNTLLVQASPQEWEKIQNLLLQLDVAPRQVLIDAKIYEVDLDNELAGGVESFLQQRGSSAATGATGNGVTPGNNGGSIIGGIAPSTVLTAAGGPGGVALTAGALVLKSHELLGVLTAQDMRSKTRVISAPSVIATDSVPATMNVGSQVPVLTSQGVAGGVQAGGSSVFANTIANQTSGVTLSITARVNSSGIVTMIIDQQVSAPVAPPAGSTIQSPSFSNRSVSTQITVQDGDTVAIGGIITENHTESSGGVPFLHRIPILGAAFGAKNYSTQRTELIIFLTPRVIYDSNQLTDATEELKGSLKRVQKLMKE